ncbi:MAG: lamin tail domain-containing protein [Lewinellaceae bacterium]|nr:lamin tail domain-containing protein [Lewinellaceae bacterium]
MRRLTLTGMLLGGMLSLQAQITDLLISEYVEGSSNNKYVELYNGTGSPLNLGSQNYVVEVYANGSFTPTSSIILTGVIAPGDVFVLAHPSATAWSGTPNQTSNGLNYNGNDAVALRKGGQLIDLIGNIGCMPDIEWGTGLLSTADNTIRRKPGACYGVTVDPPNSSCPFPTLATDWDGFPVDEVGGLGFHTTTCTPIPTVGFVGATSSLTEGNSGVTNHPVSVSMDVAPAATVTVLVADAGSGSATPGLDYVFASATLTFSPNEPYPTTKTAVVPVVGDTQAEPDETIDLTLLVTGGTANLGLAAHTIAIINDDLPSTLYSQADGSWQTPNLWNTMPDGSGVYVTDPNNMLGPTGPEYNCIIQPGHDILLPSTKGITTLLVQAGGSIKAGATSSRYLEIYGNSVIVNGVMGNGNANDGIGLEFHGPAATIGGTGTIDLNRIRKNGFTATSLTIARSLQLRYNAGAALYNDIAGYPFNVTIQPGVSVTVTRGDVSIDGVDGSNSSNRWGTFTILGALDIELGNLFLRTDNSSQDIFYTIGPGGIVSVGGQVVGGQGLAGNAKAHLTMQPGSQLVLSGAGEVLTAIDPVRDPVDCQVNSLIDYAGATAQFVEDQITYANLRSSAGGLKTLTGPTTVEGFLLLVAGHLRLNDFDLTIGPGGNAGGGSTAAYVQTTGTGALRQTVGAATRLFPVGKLTYNPLTLTNTGITDVFGVRVFDEVLQDGLSGAPLSTFVVARTWVVDEAVPGGSQATLTVQWNAGDELPGFTRSASYLSRHTSSGWTGDTPSPASGTNPYYQLRAALSEFGPFAPASNQVLPVEWLSFHAEASGTDVLLTWSTASESNNETFIVERSPDGVDFEAIAQIPGAGTTSEVHTYRYTDAQLDVGPKQSFVFYRLQQMDYDGSASYSPIRVVKLKALAVAIQIFPNPVVDRAVVRLPEASAKNVVLQLLDPMGRMVREEKIPTGTMEWEMEVNGLAAGVYGLLVDGKFERSVVVGAGR